MVLTLMTRLPLPSENANLGPYPAYMVQLPPCTKGPCQTKQVFPWLKVGSITLTFPAQAGWMAVNTWSVWPIAYTYGSKGSYVVAKEKIFLSTPYQHSMHCNICLYCGWISPSLGLDAIAPCSSHDCFCWMVVDSHPAGDRQ